GGGEQIAKLAHAGVLHCRGVAVGVTVTGRGLDTEQEKLAAVKPHVIHQSRRQDPALCPFAAFKVPQARLPAFRQAELLTVCSKGQGCIIGIHPGDTSKTCSSCPEAAVQIATCQFWASAATRRPSGENRTWAICPVNPRKLRRPRPQSSCETLTAPDSPKA